MSLCLSLRSVRQPPALTMYGGWAPLRQVLCTCTLTLFILKQIYTFFITSRLHLILHFLINRMPDETREIVQSRLQPPWPLTSSRAGSRSRPGTRQSFPTLSGLPVAFP